MNTNMNTFLYPAASAEIWMVMFLGNDREEAVAAGEKNRTVLEFVWTCVIVINIWKFHKKNSNVTF